jgi:hypothetical protein
MRLLMKEREENKATEWDQGYLTFLASGSEPLLSPSTASTRKCIGLRHYATIRKVAGARPDELNDFFQFI